MERTYSEDLIRDNIKKERKAKGWTQKTLAEKSGIDSTTISSYENKKKMPGLDSVIRIANALDITVDRLCYGDGASSLINEPVDEGRKIVNCVEYLIRAGILKKIHPFSSEMNEKHKISIEGHTIELSRFYDAVMDFQEKKHTYPDPESYYEQTMTSAANEINEKINKTKWLKNRPDPAVGNY